MNQLILDIGKAYWATIWASQDEKKYETESRKKEVGLLTEQRAIIAAIGTLDKAGKQVVALAVACPCCSPSLLCLASTIAEEIAVSLSSFQSLR